MAIRPRVIPKWATSSYGNDDIAWEEAKRECRSVLHDWCARKEPHSYIELITRVTAIPWPPGDHSSGQLGYLLGQVSLEELDPSEDRPVISSVVIASGKNEPSHGYNAGQDLAGDGDRLGGMLGSAQYGQAAATQIEPLRLSGAYRSEGERGEFPRIFGAGAGQAGPPPR